MARNRTITFYRGLKSALPTLQEGEPGFCTDTKELFIGASGGNVGVEPKITAGTTAQYWRGDKTWQETNTINAASAAKLATARAIDGVNFDGQGAISHYGGECTVAAGTAAKTAAVTGFTLVSNARVTVRFTNGNTATNPTLNVSGTGAKPIYHRGKALGNLPANAVYDMVFDGTNYLIIGVVYLSDLADDTSVYVLAK